MQTHEEILNRINNGEKKLAKVAKNLKKKFVGIDNIIDEIIQNIRVWYILPELMRQPIIICLWGLTGVGKTDLVRTLARELKFLGQFIETDLSTKTNSIWGESSIQDILEYSSIENDKPGIFLIDEIQKFRTIDQNGLEIIDPPFQDLWTLLSDGQFSTDGRKKNKLMYMYFEAVFQESSEREKREIATKEEKKELEKIKKKKFKQNIWQAKYLKKVLKLKEDVLEIMQFNNKKKLLLLKKSLDKENLFEGESFSKLLIFISGNLDEAYPMAKSINDADIDADIFYEKTKNINVVKIKTALCKRFKPEQISRFGNIHIIYPSLSKKSYKKIIYKKIKEIIISIKKNYNIKIIIDKTVYDFIYRNGVYPSQGVRPVLSTISSTINKAIPTFLMFCLKEKIDIINISHKNETLIAKAGNLIETYRIAGDLDSIKEKYEEDQKANIAVHEAAHAITYAVIFNLVPSQIIANCSLPDTGGYIGCHTFSESSNYIKKQIRVLLAGRAGEKIIFGHDLLTAGATSDLNKATYLASQYYRTFGLGQNISTKRNKHITKVSHFNSDFEESNSLIEKLLQEEKEKAKSILEKHHDYFSEISKKLFEEGKILPIEFKRISKNFGFDLTIRETQKPIYENYASILLGKKKLIPQIDLE